MQHSYVRHSLLLCAFTLSLSGTPLLAQSKAERIDALVSTYHRLRQFNGSVLVAEKGDVIFKKGYGEANRSWHIPNAPDTRFRIGSVTKQFTASVVLQLVEEGKLKLDGKISDYLPGYPKEQGGKITISQLLTHTSGIPNYTDIPQMGESIARNAFTPDSLVSVFSNLPLQFEPGASWSYSNSGYVVLGAIIEKVTGEPYDQVLRERILDPVGLASSGYDHNGEIIERQATGYVKVPGGGYEQAPYLDHTVVYSAGMMYSTVEDLFKWDQALYTDRLFKSPATKTAMFTPVLKDYGFGWLIHDLKLGTKSVKAIEHGGAIPGFVAGFRRMPEDRNTVIVMDNTSSGGVDDIVEGITQILYDLPPAEPKESAADVITQALSEKGPDVALESIRSLRASRPDAYDFNENELNSLGYYFLYRGQTDKAIAVFTLNIETHPDAFNTYDSMGEAYLFAGDTAKAITNYRKAVELNPGSRNSRMVLDQLEGRSTSGAEATVTVPEKTLQSYVGRYQLAPTFIITITKEGSQLMAQATNQPKFEIFPSSETNFYLKVVDAQLTFKRGAKGEVESLTLHQNGNSVEGKRMK